MRQILKIKIPLNLLLLLTLICIDISLAQQHKFDVLVYSRENEQMVIKDFSADGKHFFYATWRGSSVELKFEDIVKITLDKTNYDKHCDAEVELKDGRIDYFKLTILGPLKGKSEFGDWKTNFSRISMIEFIEPGTNWIKNKNNNFNVDIIYLKNGDTLSGNIQNSNIKLRTSYAELIFDTNKISQIEFEGGGQNLDVVELKVGDKLSGVVEENTISIILTSGTKLDINKDKVKRIIISY